MMKNITDVDGNNSGNNDKSSSPSLAEDLILNNCLYPGPSQIIRMKKLVIF